MPPNLVGAWKLITVEDRHENGSVHYPYGEEGLGFLIYHPDGYMSAIVMAAAANRPRLGTSTRPWDLGPEDAVAVLKTMGSAYAGTYEFKDESTVIHHIKSALIPNSIGNDEIRPFEVKDDGRLYVYTLRPPITTCAIWERLESVTG
jgi:hypothetical protein